MIKIRYLRLFERLFGFFFARDVFISYARSDGTKYATALHNRLMERPNRRSKRISVYLDRYMALPSPELPMSGELQIRTCRILVLIGSQAALNSQPVARELETFAERPRLFVPIDIGGAVASIDRSQPPWAAIRGAALEAESVDALASGNPSDTVVNRIRTICTFVTQAQRLNRAIASTIVVVALGALAALAVVREAAGRVMKANADLRLAQGAEARASKRRDAAIQAANLAEAKRIEAVAATQQADTARHNAEVAKIAAIKSTADARHDALQQSRLAAERKREADRLDHIASDRMSLLAMQPVLVPRISGLRLATAPFGRLVGQASGDGASAATVQSYLAGIPEPTFHCDVPINRNCRMEMLRDGAYVIIADLRELWRVSPRGAHRLAELPGLPSILRVSADGRAVACTASGQLIVCRLPNGPAVTIPNVGTPRLLDVGPEGRRVTVAYDNPCHVEVWAVDGGIRRERVIDASRIDAIALGPDGNTLAWVGMVGNTAAANIVSLPAGTIKPVAGFLAQSKSPHLMFVPARRRRPPRLLVVEANRYISVTCDGIPVRTRNGLPGRVLECYVGPDGRPYAVLSDGESTWMTMDLDDDRSFGTVSATNGRFLGLVWRGTAPQLLLAGLDDELMVLDPQTGALASRMPFRLNDGRVALSAHNSFATLLGRSLLVLRLSVPEVTSTQSHSFLPLVHVGPDFRRAHLLDENDRPVTVDLRTGSIHRRAHLDGIERLRPEQFDIGATVAVAASLGDEPESIIHIWDLATGLETTRPITVPLIHAMRLSPSERFLAVAVTGAVRVFDLADPKKGYRTIKSGDTHSIEFDDVEKSLALGHGAGGVTFVLNFRSNNPVMRQGPSAARSLCTVYDRNSRSWIVPAGSDALVAFDPYTGRTRDVIGNLLGSPTAVAVDGTGELLAIGFQSGTCQVWRHHPLELLANIAYPARFSVVGLAFATIGGEPAIFASHMDGVRRVIPWTPQHVLDEATRRLDQYRSLPQSFESFQD